MAVFEVQRYVEAPRTLVWEVISDVELFGEAYKGNRKRMESGSLHLSQPGARDGCRDDDMA